MIKFFRNFRKNMLMENKTSNYIKYAIGEIALVVIGILIALQINNWNERRQQNTQLNAILKSVKEDLKTDTLMAGQIIKFYDTISKYSNKYMNKEITKSNLDSCSICTSLVSIYQPMTIQEKGYKQLQNFTDYNNIKTDSLTISITQFYTVFDDLITNNNELIKKEVIENLDYFKKQPWFIQWMQGKKNDTIREYFGNSLDYRNRVASNNIFAGQNHQRMLKLYKTQATTLLDELNKRLNEDEIDKDEILE